MFDFDDFDFREPLRTAPSSCWVPLACWSIPNVGDFLPGYCSVFCRRPVELTMGNVAYSLYGVSPKP